MTSVGLSQIKTLLQDLKGEGPAKRKQTMQPQAPKRLVKRSKTKSIQEEEEKEEMEEIEMSIPPKREESLPKPKLH